MEISSIISGDYQNHTYQKTSKTNGKTDGENSKSVMKLTAVGGKSTMLSSDALFSIGSATTGESANVYRADNYSDENPIYIVKGMDANGNEYEQEIDISTVNSGNCSYIELLALNVDTGDISNSNFLQMSMIRDGAENTSYFDKMDYLSNAYELMSEQQKLGNWDSYLKWGKWIQSIVNS